MEKNKVRIRICGISFTLVSEDEPEYMEELAAEVNEEMQSYLDSSSSLSTAQAAILVAIDKSDACRKTTAASDNLRAQIKDYLGNNTRSKMEVEVARREIERLNREVSNLRDKIAGSK